MSYTKICFKCSVEKPATSFYKHKAMGDGYLGKCKDCTKNDTRLREERLKETSPEWVEKEAERMRQKANNYYAEGRYISRGEDKARIMKTYNEKFPEKKAARSGIGHLKCGKGNHLHHWSYNKEHFKDVIELSLGDHYKLHRFMRYDQAAMMYRTMDGVLLDTREKHIEYMQKVIAL